MKRSIVCVFALALIGGAISAAAQGGTSESSFSFIIGKDQAKVSILYALLVAKILLIVAIFALGLVVAALRRNGDDESAKTKKLGKCVWLGILFSLLTFINTMFLKYDYSKAWRSASGAGRCLTNMRADYLRIQEDSAATSNLEAFDSEASSLLAIYDGFMNDMMGTAAVPEAAAAAEAGGGALGLILPKAYAQSRSPDRPAWVSGIASSARYLFFVGGSSDASLKAAAEKARGDAIARAKAEFAARIARAGVGEALSDRLSAYLADYLVLKDYYYSFEEGAFRYWALAQFDRASSEDYVALFMSRNRESGVALGRVVDALRSDPKPAR